MKRSMNFPALVVQLVNAGEQSGELGPMLAKAADVYDGEVESSVATVTALLEPVVILGMGVVVGFIVISVLLPILDLTGNIK
jgi:general secretion pathway protein F